MGLKGREEQRDQHIVSLRVIIVLLFGICVAQLSQNQSLKEEQWTYTPPDLSAGGVYKGDLPGVHYVYMFTQDVFQGLNRWRKDGQTDYSDNLDAYRPYFSPSFTKVLKNEYNKRNSKGTLQGRTRTLEPIGFPNPFEKVQKISATSWVVYLDVEITERINGNIVKNVMQRFPIIIKVDKRDRQRNAIGLRIEGFYKEPENL